MHEGQTGKVPIRIWLVAALLVGLGWAAGYPLFARGDHSGFDVESFDLFEPMLVLLVGLPPSVAAGWLTSSSHTRARSVGCAVLAIDVLALAYLSSFSFYGGLCLDPGEGVCITPWSTRLSVLLAGLLALGAGFAVCAWRPTTRTLLSPSIAPLSKRESGQGTTARRFSRSCRASVSRSPKPMARASFSSGRGGRSGRGRR